MGRQRTWRKRLGSDAREALRGKDITHIGGSKTRQMQPLCQDLSRRPTEGNVPNDDCCGMASIPFPSLLQNDTLDNGLWCRGCDRTFERYRFGQLAPDVVSDLVPPGCDALRSYPGMQCRARSNAGFLDHITHCHGAQELDLWAWNER